MIFNEEMDLSLGEVLPRATKSQPNQESQELTALFHHTKETLLILNYEDMIEGGVEHVLSTFA